MGQCKYFEICGLSDDANPKDGLCILHSTDAQKDKKAFREAFEAHRTNKGDDFYCFVFPEVIVFQGTTFQKKVNFRWAIFAQGADFIEARFNEGADFKNATFSEWADFLAAIFTKGGDFGGATFSREAIFAEALFSGDAGFGGARFAEEATFSGARFIKKAGFRGTTFSQGADFQHASFSGEVDFSGAKFNKEATFLDVTFSEGADFKRAKFTGGVDFFGARFTKGASFWAAEFTGSTNFGRGTFAEGGDFKEAIFDEGDVIFEESTLKGRTLFISRKEEGQTIQVFSGVDEVNFKSVTIDPPDLLTFIEADLTKCLFLNTNLQKVNFFAVDWPKIKGRFGVYDEMKLSTDDKGKIEGREERREKENKSIFLAQLERLYRELKKNYEDNRDYERAGHFHYGEKEMRRENPKTSYGLKLLLILYKWFSGYGESWGRPLTCIGLLLGFSTVGYLFLGILPQGGKPQLIWTNPVDWFHGLYYSLRVMTLLKPNDFFLGDWAKVIHTTQSILGPLFITLLALAIRQKLKR